MIDDVLKARFEQYAPTSALEQENVLKETIGHARSGSNLRSTVSTGPWRATTCSASYRIRNRMPLETGAAPCSGTMQHN